MVLIGSGPATFYSRAAMQFFPLNLDRLYQAGTVRETGNVTYRASDSMGGLIKAASRPAYFHHFYDGREGIFAIGTAQVDAPFSFYTGLLGETGILGVAAYMSIYLFIFRRLRSLLAFHAADAGLLPLITATYGLLVYFAVNSIYTPLLESGRMTTILWTLIALCFVLHRRRLAELEAEEEAEERAATNAHPVGPSLGG